MSEKTIVDFIEEWQTGAALLLASAFVGLLVGSTVGNRSSAVAGFVSFFVGSILAFLAFSYLLYGR